MGSALDLRQIAFNCWGKTLSYVPCQGLPPNFPLIMLKTVFIQSTPISIPNLALSLIKLVLIVAWTNKAQKGKPTHVPFYGFQGGSTIYTNLYEQVFFEQMLT